MSQQSQLIGIIEMDIDPGGCLRQDATIDDALRSLRQECGIPADHRLDHRTLAEDQETCDEVETIHVLHANLSHLRSELEHDLRRLIQRLLAAM